MAATTLIDRALLRLSGEDVRGFLQGLVTNDMALLAPDRPLWAGLLTPQGKALFDFIVWPSGRDLLIDCEADAADALVKRLSLYRLRRDIAIARDGGLAVHWRPHTGDGAAPDPRLHALGERWVAPIDETDPEEAETGADAAWRAHRLALGVPEGRAELGDVLWLETNAAELNGVSFSKGCYVGQENTARMNWRQKVNRRLVVMRTPENPGEPANIYYPDLGLAVLRVSAERLGAGADPVKQEWFIRPDWLNAALAQSGEM